MILLQIITATAYRIPVTPWFFQREEASMGLSSPSANRVVVGDPFTSAFGSGSADCQSRNVATGRVNYRHQQVSS